jgi:hypothetical protein
MLATESFGRPVLAAGRRTFPGASRSRGVGGQDDAQNRSKPTAVEDVRLDHKDRSPQAGFGSPGLPQIGPPDLTALYYHSPESTLRACALRSDGWTPEGSSA